MLDDAQAAPRTVTLVKEQVQGGQWAEGCKETEGSASWTCSVDAPLGPNGMDEGREERKRPGLGTPEVIH